MADTPTKETLEVLDMIKHLKDVQDQGASKEDVDAKVAELRERLDESDERLKTYEEVSKKIEAKMNRAPSIPDGSDVDKATEHDRKEFSKYLKSGRAPVYTKTLATDDLTTGGVFVPTILADQIVELVTEIDPIESLSDNVVVSEGDAWEDPTQTANGATGWVAERQARAQTDGPRFGSVTTPLHQLYAEPWIARKMLNTSSINIESWLVQHIATQLAQTSGTGYVNGTGVGQPFGLMQNADINRVDCGNAGAIVPDDLINMIDLEPEYTRSAVWLMRRSTMLYLWQMQSGFQVYYLTPDLSRAGAFSILGSPIVNSPSVQAGAAGSAAGTQPIFYGDVQQLYRTVRHSAMTVIRDEYTDKSVVKFYTETMVGGNVKDANAGNILNYV